MKERVLLVDDDELVRTGLGTGLEQEGFEVELADSASAALHILKQRKLDAVLLDIFMPDLDGIEVLREVKTKESDTEVIILTGHSDEATAIDCLRLGAYDYFCKPLEDIDVLLTAVERVLEKRDLELKNRSLGHLPARASRL